MQRIDQSGRANDGGTVLVIMENRNIHQFAQLLFNDKAVRRTNVFQINAAKGRPQMLDGVDEGGWVFRVDLKIN